MRPIFGLLVALLGLMAPSVVAAQGAPAGRCTADRELKMFHAIARTKRLYDMLMQRSDGAAMIAAWQADVA